MTAARPLVALLADVAATRDAIVRRDDLIEEAYTSGFSMRQAGELFGLRPQTIHAILHRRGTVTRPVGVPTRKTA